MRAYQRITNLEIDFTAYRDQPCGEFAEKYPGTNVTARRISDERRVTVGNHQLLPALLGQTGLQMANGFIMDSDGQQNAKFEWTK